MTYSSATDYAMKYQLPPESREFTFDNGDIGWFYTGPGKCFHRKDGPAFISKEHGFELWYKLGKRHRLDGPAIQTNDGVKRWFIEGIEYTEEEFNKKLKEYTV